MGRISYEHAKNWIRSISRMDKRDKKCFITSEKKVENHHLVNVSSLASFVAHHPSSLSE